jgi:hypothetical protein
VRAATLVLCQHEIHFESTQVEAAQGHAALWQVLSLLALLVQKYEY